MFDVQQLKAVEMALANRFTVVNGYAGSGKTTIIRQLCKALKLNGRTFHLCAFAGRAAARMRDVTECHASTIHSMLGWRGDGLGFTVKSLAGSTVILDEASMVPSWLLAEIIVRNPDRLVLVGDEGQLPPVGAGQPFHDIVHHGNPKNVITLNTCYRNKAAINRAASEIRDGRLPLSGEEDGERLAVINVNGAIGAHHWILNVVRKGEIDFSRDIVLCPANGADYTPATIESLNRDIANIIIPRDEFRLVDGDRAINTKNNPELDIWNGTTGSVKLDAGGAAWLTLDVPNADGEKSVLVPKAEVKHLRHAYALTIHKAQGSQYRKVVLVCLRRDTHILLDRSMLYTGVTRAQKECVILTDGGALSHAIGRTAHRRTLLQQLLTKGAIA